MSLQHLNGFGFYYPEIPPLTLPPALDTSSLKIDAAGEKIAFNGRVFFPERTGTKAISRIGFRFAAVVKSGGSGLTLSLQDVSTALGPPGRPDGTPDQTVAISNADITGNTWYRTNALNADRTVSFGDLLSVVIEFDGTGWLASDSIIIATSTPSAALQAGHNFLPTLYTTTWTNQNVLQLVVLEFSDGTFGTLDGALPLTAFNTHAFNVDTAVSDEYALPFQVPAPVKIDGAWVYILTSASSDFEVILYSGTTALATASIDYNTVAFNNSARPLRVVFPETSLSANTTYYLAVRPTTTNNITVYSFDVNDANHLNAWQGGTVMNFATRLDQGAWASATATRRMLAGIRISSLDDGIAAGGLLVHPGMSGGMRA